jgi:D-alanyl-D-alanine carboxypeptidase
MTTLALAAAMGVVGAGTAHADTKTRPTLRAVLQTDADRLLDYGAPGVLVELDTERGDVQVRSGYGNVAKRSPVPWNAKFRIGSFTKPFVAATLLQLVGEGRLSLEDPVDRWLPGVVRGNGNDGRRITVRQLLQHTSGVPEYLQPSNLPWVFEQEAFLQNRFTTLTSAELVALAVKQPPNFPPGTQWSYSNTNYTLAGMIIEKVSGQTWQQQTQRRIIRPLGLRHTYTPVTAPNIPRPHAVGYERWPGPDPTPEDPGYGEPVDVTQQNPSYAGPAGEIISTTDDTNRFLRALVTGRVLRPAQLAEMQKTVPATLFEGNWPGARYGLGLLWVPNSCGGSWGHGGDIPGFQTRNGVTPDGSRSVIVSINTDTFKRKSGVPAPTKDITSDLIDHALCGRDRRTIA